MKSGIKKLILSSRILTKSIQYFHKKKLKRKYKIRYAKNVFISFSSICEGMNFFDSNSSIIGSKIGYASYLGAGTNITKTKVGRYCSIGPNVNCIFGKHPTNTFVSTHPAFFSLHGSAGLIYTSKQKFKEHEEPKDSEGKYSILIGNDVWIGANVSIIDGVTIGDGAIVASNALVNKDIPPYSIFGGVPAKEIKKRFTNQEIEFLVELKWWNNPESWIINHSEYFEDIQKFQNKIQNA